MVIVFIMYKLCEVCEVVDKIIIVCFGCVVGEVLFIVSNGELVLFMVGCVVELMVYKDLLCLGDGGFEVMGLCVFMFIGVIVVDGVDFVVWLGEVFVIVGV